MIETQPPLERAILVSAPVRGSDHERHAEEHLDELERLADTAGAEVTGRLIQRVKKISPKLLIGSGKLEELEAQTAASEATLVIFDEELSPVQGKNLEDALQIRVMDRAELILDIFATRARTNEAKMQVELAQLEYLLPRLARMWTHLSRIRGGIGLRGPGETQIETDRRLIRRKISQLKKKLKAVARHRKQRGRRATPDHPRVLLPGLHPAAGELLALAGARGPRPVLRSAAEAARVQRVPHARRHECDAADVRRGRAPAHGIRDRAALGRRWSECRSSR